MSIRIRRCLECPKCHTRYLLGFSPYSNGSYVVSVGAGSLGGICSVLLLRAAAYRESLEFA